jgi:hypothetical protein
MASLKHAGCFPHWWKDTTGAAEACSVCAVALACYPCVVGSSFHKSMEKTPTEANLLINTSEECGTVAGFVCFGHIVPCVAAMFVRMREEQFIPACLAETFPLCSCSPCQFEMYRRGNSHKIGCC